MEKPAICQNCVYLHMAGRCPIQRAYAVMVHIPINSAYKFSCKKHEFQKEE